MEQKAGAQINKKVFIQSVLILFILMLLAGLMTRVIPSGKFMRQVIDGKEEVIPGSFNWTEKPDYPVWRWITATIEVLWNADAAIIITIILFILIVGGAFAILEASGILHAVIARIVKRFGANKYTFLLVISFFFMLIGAVFGLFEEIVPLVPLMIAFSYYLGWDVLVGLGMSILATNLGFSAAITNPFTIGVAQRLAGLSLFSGIWLRIIIFIAIYLILALFLSRYARRIEGHPENSLVYGEDDLERTKYQNVDLENLSMEDRKLKRALMWFLASLLFILITLFSTPFFPILSEISLPLVGLMFLIGSAGAGIISGFNLKFLMKAFGQGMTGIAPGVPLILMAASIKYIATTGGVVDTILYHITQSLFAASPFVSVLLMYALALFMELFVASAGAKAVLIMPILIPLADLIGVTRQTLVTAYCFGDGFSNLAYPTNPVLLITLGLAMISYPKWLRWTLKLWLWIVLVTVFFLWIAVIIHYV